MVAKVASTSNILGSPSPRSSKKRLDTTERRSSQRKRSHAAHESVSGGKTVVKVLDTYETINNLKTEEAGSCHPSVNLQTENLTSLKEVNPKQATEEEMRKIEILRLKLLDEVSKVVKEKDAEIERLKREKDFLEGSSKARIDELNTTLTNMMTEKASVEKALEKEEGKVENLAELIKPLKKNVQDSAEKNQRLVKIVDQLTEDKNKLLERNKILTNELAKTVESLRKEKQNFEKDKTYQNSMIVDQDIKINCLESELAKEVEVRKETEAKLKSLSESQESVKLTFEKKIQEKEEAIRVFQLEMTKLRVDLKKIENEEASTSSKEHQTLKTKIVELNQKLNSANDEIKCRDILVDSKEAHIKVLDRRLSDAKEQAASSEAKVKTKDEEVKKLKERVSDLETHSSARDEEVKELETKIRKLESVPRSSTKSKKMKKRGKKRKNDESPERPAKKLQVDHSLVPVTVLTDPLEDGLEAVSDDSFFGELVIASDDEGRIIEEEEITEEENARPAEAGSTLLDSITNFTQSIYLRASSKNDKPSPTIETEKPREPTKQLTVEEQRSILLRDDDDDEGTDDNDEVVGVSSVGSTSAKVSSDVPEESLLSESPDKVSAKQPYSPAKTSSVNKNVPSSVMVRKTVSPEKYFLKLKPIKSLIPSYGTQDFIVPSVHNLSDIAKEDELSSKIRERKDLNKLQNDVSEVVRMTLNKYYHRGVISSKEEFADTAKKFTNMFRDEIKEAYTREHENLLGIVMDSNDKFQIIDNIMFYYKLRESITNMLSQLPKEKRNLLRNQFTDEFFPKLRETLDALNVTKKRESKTLSADFC